MLLDLNNDSFIELKRRRVNAQFKNRHIHKNITSESELVIDCEIRNYIF